ncbi:hypothetical protein J3L16_11445 [Alteromonas sp. 5E99-2]|nr:hypothetical protein [Alteromonas sp. 5E99-2]
MTLFSTTTLKTKHRHLYALMLFVVLIVANQYYHQVQITHHHDASVQTSVAEVEIETEERGIEDFIIPSVVPIHHFYSFIVTWVYAQTRELKHSHFKYTQPPTRAPPAF